MPCWTFERPDRLRALADRTCSAVENLRREAMDWPRGSEARASVGQRMALLGRRLDRLRMLARVARHNARIALAGEVRS